MLHVISIGFLVGVLAVSCATRIEPTMPSIQRQNRESLVSKWFSSVEYVKVAIKKQKSFSDSSVVKEIMIQDPSLISFLKSQVEKNPVDGKMMISFAPESSYISIQFVDAQGTIDLVEIHDGRLKTPSTGFDSTKSAEETRLSSDIEALLQPGLSVPILKVVNNEYKFKDMSVVYLGKSSQEKSRATTSLSKERYQIKEAQGGEQILEITSGQRPPAPVEFKVNGKMYTLFTYENTKKIRLFPHYFEITK